MTYMVSSLVPGLHARLREIDEQLQTEQDAKKIQSLRAEREIKRDLCLDLLSHAVKVPRKRRAKAGD